MRLSKSPQCRRTCLAPPACTTPAPVTRTFTLDRITPLRVYCSQFNDGSSLASAHVPMSGLLSSTRGSHCALDHGLLRQLFAPSCGGPWQAAHTCHKPHGQPVYHTFLKMHLKAWSPRRPLVTSQAGHGFPVASLARHGLWQNYRPPHRAAVRQPCRPARPCW